LAVVPGFVIRVLESTKIIALIRLLVIQFAGFALAVLPQAGLEKLDQPIDQPLLPADNVEAALVPMLLQNFADAAF
jgi:hypothetical protein